jgi:hypothetical protein
VAVRWCVNYQFIGGTRRAEYASGHAVQTPQHIIVCDSQNPVPKALSVRLACTIIHHLSIVAHAINLVHKPQRRAERIHDIRADHRLSSNRQSGELTLANDVPEHVLGMRGLIAQIGRTSLHVWRHSIAWREAAPGCRLLLRAHGCS